ncbi:MAG: helix-turn-helix domain-containing protein [Eubacterium sp.]|nr:helix-turn-helix domain-containing protein [Eubacterium sp.]
MAIKIFWGNILKQLRHEYGITQQELADVMHISRQQYCSLEKGRVQPSVEHLVTLSNIYDTDLYNYAAKCMPDEMLAEQQQFKLRMSPRKSYEVLKRKRKSHKSINVPDQSNKKDNYIDPINVMIEEENEILIYEETPDINAGRKKDKF